KQLLLQGAAGDEIEHEHRTALADAIDAANALLDRHRIPWHVEIDQGIAELDVAPFAARLRAQKEAYMVPKRGDRCVFLRTAQTPVETRQRNAGFFQTTGKMSKRLARIDENELLFGRVAPDEVKECGLFAAGLDPRPSIGQLSPHRIVAVTRRDPSDRPRSPLWR